MFPMKHYRVKLRFGNIQGCKTNMSNLWSQRVSVY